VEAITKLVVGLSLSWIVMREGRAQIAAGSDAIFGIAVSEAWPAENIVYAAGAAAAILGVSVSTFFGWVYLRLRFKKDGTLSPEQIAVSPPASGAKELIKSLLRIAIPVCISSLVISLTTLIDTFSITNRLAAALQTAKEVVFASHGGALPLDMALADLPNYIYGTYQYALTMFQLVPAITTAFGVSGMPAVSAAYSVGDRKELSLNIHSVLRVTSLVCIPAGFGLSVLAEPILSLFYKAEAVAVAAPVLRLLGIAVIFVALVTPVNSMFSGIGRPDIPVKLMLFGAVIKLAVNYTLVGVPSINILGAPVGTMLCYGFLAISGIIMLCRKTKVNLNLISVFGKPLLCGVLCAAAAWVSFTPLSGFLPNSIATVGAIGIAGVVYAGSLLLVRGIAREDILMLPKGKKIAKTLEKYHLLG